MTADTTHHSDLSQEVRDGIAAVVDVVLPGTDRLPSGISVGAHLDLLDRVLAADPGLLAAVVAVGAKAAAGGCPPLDQFSSWAQNDCEAAVFALTAAYYLAPDVLRALHYPGLGPRPIALAKPDEITTDDLLAPVRDRGLVYVPAPN